MITVRLSAVPLPGPGYVKRSADAAAIILNPARYSEDDAAALQILIGAALGEGVLGWWQGEIVPLAGDGGEPDLPIRQAAM